MTRRALSSPLTFSLVGAAALALAACERTGDPAPDEEEPVTSAEPLSDPATPEGEEPVASIIRSDVAADPVVDLPPEPLEMTIAFPEGAELTETARRRLADVLESEALAEGWPIVLRGHSDAAGSDEVNLRASRRRAEAVARWLVERGVDEERIRVIAFGEQNPVAPNADPQGEPDEAGRAQNRRVELAIEPPAGEPTAREALVEQGETVLESAVERIGGATR